jgi:uncharacterized GH25 family protein
MKAAPCPLDQERIITAMLSLSRGATALLLLSTASVLRAHDTWLSGPAESRPGVVVPFQLTSSGAFPTADDAVEPGRVEKSICRVGGQESPLRAGSRMRHALRLRARELGAGTAACGVTLQARTLELQADEVAHYLEEIGAARTVGPKWEKAPAPRQWRETYVKHAKTYLRMGTKGDESWREPLGLGLEIVPLADPIRLREGATLEVRVLKAGQPLAGLPLRASREGKPAAFATTGDDGRASFALDAAGPWLLAGTDLRPSVARPSEWESDFTTLYLVVAK